VQRVRDVDSLEALGCESMRIVGRSRSR
jgi:hypothetical protein